MLIPRGLAGNSLARRHTLSRPLRSQRSCSALAIRDCFVSVSLESPWPKTVCCLVVPRTHVFETLLRRLTS